MEFTVSVQALRLLRAWTLAWAACTLQTLGPAGLAGAGLLLVSAVWLGQAWHAQRRPLPEEPLPAPIAAQASRATASPALALPPRSEVLLLLTEIQESVVHQGLAWPAADYKLLAATEGVPAILEVRCTLKGSYPKLRAVIGQLLSGVTGLAIRDLALARANSDTSEVEAKLRLAVFLQDETGAAEFPRSPGKP